MTLRFHIQLVGALLLSLGIAHGFFGRYFGWEKELQSVSLLTRRIFQVHCFFIALLVALLGIGSLFFADALLVANPSSRLLLAGIVLFWFCRLLFQLFVYDAAIWKGRRFYTCMHAAFSLFWIYVVATYSVALRHVWN